ncbi:hypothetical protein LXL04_033678 [Taraxacum kok-saghyz]
MSPQHNGFEVLPWMDMIISRDPLYSSLDIVPSHNQCLLPAFKLSFNNVQELGKSSGERADGKLREAILILERERKKMEEIPYLKLEHNTKKLRQACFKANYKKRRTMGMMGPMSNSLRSNVIVF